MISNAGLHNTYSRLLPPGVLDSHPEMQEQLLQATAAGTSTSIAVLYLGIDEPLLPEFEGLGSLRVYNSADFDGDVARFMADPNTPLPFVEICCCDGREAIMPDNPAGSAAVKAAAAEAERGSRGRGQGVSTLQVMTFVNYDWFKPWSGTKWHHRGEDYEAFKQDLQGRLMAKLGE